jgi:hypothetical protein
MVYDISKEAICPECKKKVYVSVLVRSVATDRVLFLDGEVDGILHINTCEGQKQQDNAEAQKKRA